MLQRFSYYFEKVDLYNKKQMYDNVITG